MTTALWVTLGGAAGTLARYLVTGAVNFRGHPWGTVTVNLIGSLLIGLLVGYWGMRLSGGRQLGIGVGFLGGFTTFSAFALDTVYLVEKGRVITAAASVIVSVIGGVALAAIGIALGRAGN